MGREGIAPALSVTTADGGERVTFVSSAKLYAQTRIQWFLLTEDNPYQINNDTQKKKEILLSFCQSYRFMS